MTPLIRHSYCNPVAGYGYEEWDPFFRNSYLAGALSSEGRHMIPTPLFRNYEGEGAWEGF